jgi:hypothetical protein
MTITRDFAENMKTSSDLSLRLARPADATAIANMSRELIENGLLWRWTAQRVVASINAENTNVLVARLDNRLAGFGIMKYGDRIISISSQSPPTAGAPASVANCCTGWNNAPWWQETSPSPSKCAPATREHNGSTKAWVTEPSSNSPAITKASNPPCAWAGA